MFQRQIVATCLVGALLSIVAGIFLQRRQINTTAYFNQPGFKLGCIGFLLAFILAIILATPIEPADITKLLNVLLIIVGILETVIGGLLYIIFPNWVAEHLETEVHLLYMQQLAVSHIAIGVTYCVVGAQQSINEATIVLICLWGWLRAAVHFYRGWPSLAKNVAPLTSSDPHDTNPNPNHNPPPTKAHNEIQNPAEASLACYELMEALFVPVVFLFLFVCSL